ncbi:conserved hypothetical protein [Rhodopseudomonas palustris HaA2]|uniref:Methyltransferase type 11 domain-containing protein n=1 Tax=Rhodopseudomonas palustris (strain HaA2) TaxID=316058 RepID=Q2IZV1_RHOP2|nr:conserved hypothetical protein [Rhodopseudomonas palustris HaA2]
MPWWVKLGAKLGLARLPVPYGFWKRIGIFRHGEMMVPERAIAAFESHFKDAQLRHEMPAQFQSLELGPGDSVLSGFVARAFGARRAWLVDAGAFAETDVQNCREAMAILTSRGMPAPSITGATIREAMDQANVVYLTEGTRSLAAIPDGSVDFFWSQVVLEHVPRADFSALMQELRRVAAPDAIGVHSIDFRDHLGGGLNNLRFSDAIWESKAFSGSGFYTNRLRPREMIDQMKAAGFAVEVVSEQRWPALPLPRAKMAPQFRAFAEEDFLVCDLRVVIRPL